MGQQVSELIGVWYCQIRERVGKDTMKGFMERASAGNRQSGSQSLLLLRSGRIARKRQQISVRRTSGCSCQRAFRREVLSLTRKNAKTGRFLSGFKIPQSRIMLIRMK